MNPGGSVWAIVLSGGRGARFGGPTPKQFLSLAGEPVLLHALRALLAPEEVRGAVVPHGEGMEEDLREQVLAPLGSVKPVRLVPGGAERMDSVAAGLSALPEEAAWVLVHDGARPNPGPEMLRRLLEARSRARAVLPVLPVTDTIKQVDGEGFVCSTVDRGPLRRAQTPQLFSVELLSRAHSDGRGLATDDAQLVEWLGEPVLTVEGSPGNIKLTLPGDLAILESWMGRG